MWSGWSSAVRRLDRAPSDRSTRDDPQLNAAVRSELARHTATFGARVNLVSPLAAVAAFAMLHGHPTPTREAVWVVLASLSALVSSVWCFRNQDSATISLWRLRCVLAVNVVVVVSTPIWFSEQSNTTKASLEILVTAALFVVLLVMLAGDQWLSYLALVGTMAGPMLGSDAMGSLSWPVRITVGISGLLLLSCIDRSNVLCG
jgi:hypothetical protein